MPFTPLLRMSLTDTLRHSLLLSSLLLLASACTPAPAPEAQSSAPTGAAMSPPDPSQTLALPPDPAADGLTTLRQRLADRQTSSRAVVEAYLARIAALDDAGPQLNAVIDLAPDALAQADRLDAERSAGHLRGPLHGIPVLIKDNIDATPMVTTAGSLALADHHPSQDAHLITRLRAAGLIILGKTNLSEWANFRSTRSSSGWSARGGQTRNPHVLDRSPCGSSSGSAAAVAAGLAPLAVGTETNGSIICPAAVNGIVGLKPTVGRVSRHGIVPIAPSQDTAGPMARTVADAALLLAAMSGSDPHDPSSTDADAHDLPDFSNLASSPDAARPLTGLRIGVMRKAMGFHSRVDHLMEQAIAHLAQGGAEIIDPADLPSHGQFNAPAFQVLLHEFRPALEDYLRRTDAPLRTLDQLIAFNQQHADTELRWFGQELFEQAAALGSDSHIATLEARASARRLAGPEGIDAALSTHRLDALLTTAVSPAWTIDPINGDRFLGAGYGAAAVAGYPSITVPAGAIDGLPVGIVFMSTAWKEPELIAIAHAYERLSQARIDPLFRPSLGR